MQSVGISKVVQVTFSFGDAVDFSQSQNNLSVVASIAKKYGIYDFMDWGKLKRDFFTLLTKKK